VIGLSYFSGVEPLLRAAPELVDVLEIEPQTFWLQPDSQREAYRLEERAVERIRSFPHPKLLHGIGFPVGGTEPPSEAQLAPFLRTCRALDPLWVSEHLSFNRARAAGGPLCTGFLLPPRQTPAGVAAAVHSIRAMADRMPVPFAVETGVNYLRPRADEMRDGAFLGEVVERADCGILLDLHNLWCNERNGRQRIEDFLAEIPLERVWEIHLAGGSASGAYWLDSHSGAIPRPVLELAGEVIPRLPGLRAIVFELFPEYLPLVGDDLVREQLEAMRHLPAPNGVAFASGLASARPTREQLRLAAGPSPAEWEDALGALVVRRQVASDLHAELGRDPAIEVIRKLIDDFRASMVAGVLKLTLRLLLLALGRDEVDRLFAAYWMHATPRRFASAEAEEFATWLAEQDLDVPHLRDVLAFERAVLDTLLHGETSLVRFHADPLVVLRSLAEARFPDSPRAGAFEVEITPDAAAAGDRASAGRSA
jgi:uncharacterized protein (UPF0276 family)